MTRHYILPAQVLCMCEVGLGGGFAVVEVSLHLPVPEVELALCATLHTRNPGMPAARDGAAEFPVPATKHSRHEISNLRHHLTSVKLSSFA